MPGDTKPHKARQAKKNRRRARKMGDLTDARKKLWQAVACAEDLLLDVNSDADLQLKAVHALTQATTAYAKLIEVGELEARLTELEQTIEAQREPRLRRYK